MRKLLPHRRPDGLVEAARVGRPRHAAVALAVAVLGLPAALMVLVGVVAVFPVVALAIPSAVVSGVYLLLMRLRDHGAVGNVGRVIPLYRG